MTVSIYGALLVCESGSPPQLLITIFMTSV